MKKKIVEVIDKLKNRKNYSIYQAIYDNNRNRLDNIAIEYRKNRITYREMFRKVDEYACSLSMMGYKKGSEILACVSNTPEFIYLLLAAAKIGAKFNTIGEWFDKDYLEEIIASNGSRRIFISDDNYEALKDVLENSDSIDEIVAFSLNDSLPVIDGIKKDPFEDVDRHFKSFDNKVADISKNSKKKVISQNEFLSNGAAACYKEYCFRPIEEKAIREFFKANLNPDDDFIITYTSSSTNPGRPKATLHPVKSLVFLSRFKESDVSGMPTMKNVRAYAHIPSYVLAGISTSITDPLYLGCTVIPEPIYDKDYFPYGLVLNKPNMSGGSVGFWGNLANKFEDSPYFSKLKMPYLYLALVTGEAMGLGEEKWFNRMARKHKFGTAKLPFPLAPVTFSIGGGTNEITGIFVTLFRSLQEKNPFRKANDMPVGQTPLACAEVDVVDRYGNSVGIGEFGEIIVKTECGMKRYYYEDGFKTQNAKTKTDWYKMGAYGVKLDELPHVQIKGRLTDCVYIPREVYRPYLQKNVLEHEEYPLFKINDLVEKDTKNILSSSVVLVPGEEPKIVIHFEPQRYRKIKAIEDLENSIVQRLSNELPDYIKDRLYIRYRSSQESFPIAPSGKRDTLELKKEGVENAISFRDIEKRNEKGKKLMLNRKVS